MTFMHRKKSLRLKLKKSVFLRHPSGGGGGNVCVCVCVYVCVCVCVSSAELPKVYRACLIKFWGRKSVNFFRAGAERLRLPLGSPGQKTGEYSLYLTTVSWVLWDYSFFRFKHHFIWHHTTDIASRKPSPIQQCNNQQQWLWTEITTTKQQQRQQAHKKQ